MRSGYAANLLLLSDDLLALVKHGGSFQHTLCTLRSWSICHEAPPMSFNYLCASYNLQRQHFTALLICATEIPT